MGSLQEELYKKGLSKTKPTQKVEENNWGKKAEEYSKKANLHSNNRNNYHNNRQSNGCQSTNSTSHNNKQMQTKTIVFPQESADTPYNFIGLPQEIVTAELNDFVINDKYGKTISDRYAEFIKDKGNHTGYIELAIETLTPCFIGGNGENFFSPTGQPMIPGSSLRGMTKNLCKMVTCGAMRSGEDIKDINLYFRCIMAPGSSTEAVKVLNQYYNDQMTYINSKTNETAKKTKPGFLIKKNNQYYICPAKCKSEDFNGRQQPQHADIKWRIKEQEAVCYTGQSLNPKKPKTSYRVIHEPDWDTRIPIHDKVINNYKIDKGRGDKDVADKNAKHSKGIDLFERALKNNKTDKDTANGFVQRADLKVDMVVPCFYVEKDGEIQHFGHGRSYRIPYETSIAEHIPQGLKSDVIDFADAIFGKESLWASRVMFEDAYLQGIKKTETKTKAKPLLSPHPTSFQLYLEQNDNIAKHWDHADKPKIRGYKMYWHNKNEWKLPTNNSSDKNESNVSKTIEPLASESKFKTRVMFKDLSNIELGALLKVFAINPNKKSLCYKIGMGKPIGLGSVAINAQLYLMDEKSRYNSLFAENDWQEAYSPEAIEAFTKKFDKYMDGANEAVLEEMAIMMDWNNLKKSGWTEKTSYMQTEGTRPNKRYAQRAVLPTVKEVVK